MIKECANWDDQVTGISDFGSCQATGVSGSLGDRDFRGNEGKMAVNDDITRGGVRVNNIMVSEKGDAFATALPTT